MDTDVLAAAKQRNTCGELDIEDVMSGVHLVAKAGNHVQLQRERHHLLGITHTGGIHLKFNHARMLRRGPVKIKAQFEGDELLSNLSNSTVCLCDGRGY